MKRVFDSVRFLKALFVLSGVLAFFAFRETWLHIQIENYDIWHSRRSLMLVIYGVNILGVLALLLGKLERFFENLLEKPSQEKSAKILGAIVLLAMSFLPAAIILFDKTQFIQPLYSLLWVAWWAAIVAMLFLQRSFDARVEGFFALALLGIAFVARVESWIPFISTFPFSLGWSEASRYYYASLFYGERIYGEATAWSFLHPTRYLLQSVPFLFRQMPLWVHRAWQVFLWFSLSLGAGFAFASRVSKEKKALFYPLALWFFIFSLQGAVYYHLQVVVLIILLGTKRNDLKRSLGALIFASIWAGISRVNWIPVPAMLTIFLFLLEEPVSNYKNLWDYLKKPIVWTVAGLGFALASQSLYVFISGNSDNIASFGSSFTSSLLWYRLLPNTTYHLGIILSTAFVSFPAFGLIFVERTQKHWVRKLGMWAILLVLLLGGLVVSTKIGGGGDLHNMDAFLVVLGVWAGYVFVGGINGEEPVSGHPVQNADPVWVAFAVLIPFWLAMRAMSPIPEYDFARAEKNLNTIREVVAEANQKGEDVLFITQRHLLSFGMVENVALEPKYDVVELMEMAMSGNMLYLETFYDDLYSHRFGVIIAPPQFTVVKDEQFDSFAEENNAWVTQVSEHILCTYQASPAIKKAGITIFLPKEITPDCRTGR